MKIFKLSIDNFHKQYNKAIRQMEQNLYENILYSVYQKAKEGYKSYSVFWFSNYKLSLESYDKIINQLKEEGFKIKRFEYVGCSKVEYKIIWKED